MFNIEDFSNKEGLPLEKLIKLRDVAHANLQATKRQLEEERQTFDEICALILERTEREDV